MPAARSSSIPFTIALRDVVRRTCAAAFACAVALMPVSASAQSVPIVRDAEIEALMRDYARPILQAAGLGTSGIEIVLVGDNSFNAFVTGRRIFFNTGALLQADTPNQVIGVLAHEAGHLAGGHQERLHDQLRRANTLAIAGALLGMGLGAAGAATGNQGLSSFGAGMAFGTPEMARRGLLGYQRTEEATADRSALTYLQQTGQSPRGMLETFERIAGSLALAGVRLDPYQLSHPTPRDRIANLQTVAQQSPYFDRKDPPALQLRHDMMRAKIAAYTQGQMAVQRLFRDDPLGTAAQYGDAILTHLYGNPRQAVDKIDRLLTSQPQNPYLHELRGDALIKAGRADDAAKAYQRAVSLDPARSGMLRVGYGQALLATGRPDNIRKAIGELRAGVDADPDIVTAYRYLAQAYGQTGEIGMAELYTAEGHYRMGQFNEAKIFAARSQQKLQRGTPPWRRAQDIIEHEPPR